MGTTLKSDANKLLKNNHELNQLEVKKVINHVQREEDGWVLNSIMLDGYDVPFKYRRKKLYRNLKGARVNLTYYPKMESVSGLEFEYMKVVRIRVA